MKLQVLLCVVSFTQVFGQSKEFFDLKFNSLLPTSLCNVQLKLFQEKLDQNFLWARKMRDSWGNVPNGIFSGNIFDFGGFDQCIEFRHDTEGVGEIVGQHCTLFISAESLTSNQHAAKFMAPSRSLDQNLGIGICVPASCQPEEVKIIADNILSNNFNFTTSTTYDQNLFCTTENRPHESSTALLISAAIFFSSIIILMTLSTCYDVICEYFNVTKISLLISFSCYTNTKSIMSMKPSSPKEMLFLHGIRSLSMISIVTAHTYMVSFWLVPAINSHAMKDWLGGIPSLFVVNGVMGVDTFFMLSSLLMTLSVFRELDKSKKLNLAKFYLKRYFRITVPLAAAIFFTVSFLFHLSNGPLWTSSIKQVAINSCESWWWTTILFVGNYVNPPGQLCFSHSWYLMVDMQLYFLSPIILFPLWKFRKHTFIMISMIFALASSSVIFVFFMFLTHEFRVNILSELNAQKDMMVYTQAHGRIDSWMMGILVAFIMHKIEGKTFKLPKPVVFLGWTFSIAIFLAVALGQYPLQQENFKDNPLIADATYDALKRISWCLAMSWMILACYLSHGGIINKFLSLSIWLPISKLSFAIYLIHLPIQLIYLSSIRSPQFFSDFRAIYKFFGDFGVSFCVAFAWALMFEYPTLNIIQILTAKRKITILLLSSLTLTASVELDCAYQLSGLKTYTCINTNLNLEDTDHRITKVNGNHLFQFGPSNVHTIYLLSRWMRGLPLNMNTHFPKLKNYIVQGLDIKGYYLSPRSLKSGNFDGLSELELIAISGVLLRQIPEKAFSGPTSLSFLSLESCSLVEIHENAFQGLSKLVTLSLNYNLLQSLPEKIFEPLTSLKVLTMSVNYLRTLNGAWFAQTKSLEKIAIISNNLEIIDPNFTNGLEKLRSVYLDKNICVSASFGFGYKTFSELKTVLQNCTVEVLPENLIKNLQTENAELKSKLEEIEPELEKCKTGLKVIEEGKLTEGEKKNQENGELRKEVEKLKSELEELKKENKELKKQKDSSAVKDSKISELEKQLAKLELEMLKTKLEMDKKLSTKNEKSDREVELEKLVKEMEEKMSKLKKELGHQTPESTSDKESWEIELENQMNELEKSMAELSKELESPDFPFDSSSPEENKKQGKGKKKKNPNIMRGLNEDIMKGVQNKLLGSQLGELGALTGNQKPKINVKMTKSKKKGAKKIEVAFNSSEFDKAIENMDKSDFAEGDGDDGGDDDSPDDNSAESPVNDENASESPVNDGNASESPVNDENATESPVNDENATESSVNDENATESPVNDENATESPVNDENASPVNDENSTESPVNDENATESPVNDENATESPVNDEISSENSVNDEIASENLVNDESFSHEANDNDESVGRRNIHLLDRFYASEVKSSNNDESSDVQSSHEKSTDEKSADEKITDEKSTDEKSSEEKSSHKKTADEKCADEKSPDVKIVNESPVSETTEVPKPTTVKHVHHRKPGKRKSRKNPLDSLMDNPMLKSTLANTGIDEHTWDVLMQTQKEIIEAHERNRSNPFDISKETLDKLEKLKVASDEDQNDDIEALSQDDDDENDSQDDDDQHDDDPIINLIVGQLGIDKETYNKVARAQNVLKEAKMHKRTASEALTKVRNFKKNSKT